MQVYPNAEGELLFSANYIIGQIHDKNKDFIDVRKSDKMPNLVLAFLTRFFFILDHFISSESRRKATLPSPPPVPTRAAAQAHQWYHSLVPAATNKTTRTQNVALLCNVASRASGPAFCTFHQMRLALFVSLYFRMTAPVRSALDFWMSPADLLALRLRTSSL